MTNEIKISDEFAEFNIAVEGAEKTCKQAGHILWYKDHVVAVHLNGFNDMPFGSFRMTFTDFTTGQSIQKEEVLNLKLFTHRTVKETHELIKKIFNARTKRKIDNNDQLLRELRNQLPTLNNEIKWLPGAVEKALKKAGDIK